MEMLGISHETSLENHAPSRLLCHLLFLTAPMNVPVADLVTCPSTDSGTEPPLLDCFVLSSVHRVRKGGTLGPSVGMKQALAAASFTIIFVPMSSMGTISKYIRVCV